MTLGNHLGTAARRKRQRAYHLLNGPDSPDVRKAIVKAQIKGDRL